MMYLHYLQLSTLRKICNLPSKPRIHLSQAALKHNMLYGFTGRSKNRKEGCETCRRDKLDGCSLEKCPLEIQWVLKFKIIIVIVTTKRRPLEESGV